MKYVIPVVTIVLILAKIFGVEPVSSWSWFWVFVFLWGPLSLAFIIVIIALVARQLK